ncbi:hypothetical protein FA15DRAFT_709468 [Coprinopsis marcescibilis]|uniref:Uncharacterized protein n=1 Tax=Coprinopsis marcescibilis TaxID=230819 RepID=A0A5C3KSW8_COPMA|nr:hypothetical protein FA15DRAFT_709468 [Coprinopsis marcescibilis]
MTQLNQEPASPSNQARAKRARALERSRTSSRADLRLDKRVKEATRDEEENLDASLVALTIAMKEHTAIVSDNVERLTRL